MTLLDDLHAAGFDVDRVAQLRDLGSRYKEAVPIVASWLTRLEDSAEADEAVRTLASSWAKPAYGALVDALLLYTERARSDAPDAVKWKQTAWAAGNSLEVVWNDSRFDELARFVQDPANGVARKMVVSGMKKSKRPEAGEIATDLLDDEQVVLHALSVLGKHPTERARPALERLLDVPVQRVRARKVLARLDEKKGKV